MVKNKDNEKLERQQSLSSPKALEELLFDLSTDQPHKLFKTFEEFLKEFNTIEKQVLLKYAKDASRGDIELNLFSSMTHEEFFQTLAEKFEKKNIGQSERQSDQQGASPATFWELLTSLFDWLQGAADIAPEIQYAVFSYWTIILPLILKEILKLVSLPQAGPIGPIWNYVDGVCSIFLGINQSFDKTNHRQDATHLKGLVNIYSGAILILLTALSFTLLGGPAFAAAFGVGFVLSLDDLTRAYRRKNNFKYWCEDSLNELEDLNSKHIPKLMAEIIYLTSSTPENKRSSLFKWALDRKKERLKQLMNRRDEIKKDFASRFILREKKIKESQNQNNKWKKEYDDMVNVMLKKLPKNPCEDKTLPNDNEGCCSADTVLFLDQFFGRIDYSKEIKVNKNCENSSSFKVTKNIEVDYTSCSKAENDIKNKNKKEFKAAGKGAATWGVAFLGMALLCVTGFSLFIRVAVVAVAATIYGYKNINRACSVGKKVYDFGKHSFFGDNKNGKQKKKDPKKENKDLPQVNKNLSPNHPNVTI